MVPEDVRDTDAKSTVVPDDGCDTTVHAVRITIAVEWITEDDLLLGAEYSASNATGNETEARRDGRRREEDREGEGETEGERREGERERERERRGGSRRFQRKAWKLKNWYNTLQYDYAARFARYHDCCFYCYHHYHYHYTTTATATATTTTTTSATNASYG
eukprot:150668-Rhodomonas_salina.2